jgi:hypothetical protein
MGANQKNVRLDRWIWFCFLNATFNNISVKSWRSVLLVEEARIPGEKLNCYKLKGISILCADVRYK